MSPAASGAGSTPTAPARAPDGWWLQHPRYRAYVLFAATGWILAIDVLIVLHAIRALGRGAEAWRAFLASLASPVGIAFSWLLFLSTLFFALRWLRVGAKIPPFPSALTFSLPVGFYWAGHLATFALLSLALLLILAGVIL